MTNCVRWPFKWDVRQKPNHSMVIKGPSAFCTRAGNEEAVLSGPLPVSFITLHPMSALDNFYCSYTFIIAFILCFYLSRGVQSCFIVITFKGQGRGISQVHIMGSNASAVFQYRIERETQLTDPSMNSRVSATSFCREQFLLLGCPKI